MLFSGWLLSVDRVLYSGWLLFIDHVVTSPVTSERMSLKRMVDFMKDKGGVGGGGGAGVDEAGRDMNKRLQRMLEETLTKNMHLQQVLRQ